MGEKSPIRHAAAMRKHALIAAVALAAACGGSEVDALADADAGPVAVTPGVDAGSPPAAICSPACAEWAQCVAGACVIAPGRCGTDKDCSGATPVCGATHTCEPPPLSTPAALTYSGLIITNQAYAPVFDQLAQLHTLTGVPTRLTTVEAICEATPGGCTDSDACHDTPKAIKDFLMQQYGKGVRHVVLGGDATIVPSRLTHDTFSDAFTTPLTDTFFTDYYYSDLSQWDTNHDCVYGDADHDTPGYSPAIDVTRVTVSSLDDAQTYLAKARAYLTGYDTTRIGRALFLSNVAANITLPVVNTTVPIDGGLYFEAPGRTLSILPAGFTVGKLYSAIGGNWPGIAPLTISSETAALQSGYNLVVHAGHGGPWDLTVEQDGSNDFDEQLAHELQNTQTPVMLSCACEAAALGDGPWIAGQQFITAPQGGGIGYLGNSTFGLGPAGGMQFIDAMLRWSFAQKNPLLGEAVMAGHAHLPTSDALTVDGISVSVINESSWRWTQKSATFLGDGLLPMYTNQGTTAAPAVAVKRTALGSVTQVSFTPSIAHVVGTLTVRAGGDVYAFAVDGSGSPLTLTLASAPAQVEWGFHSDATLASTGTVAF